MKQFGPCMHQIGVEKLQHSFLEVPDVHTILADAFREGGVDPMGLRFRIVEYGKLTGQLIGVPAHDLGFHDAVETTRALIEENGDSHFCLEPLGYLQ